MLERIAIEDLLSDFEILVLELLHDQLELHLLSMRH